MPSHIAWRSHSRSWFCDMWDCLLTGIICSLLNFRWLVHFGSFCLFLFLPHNSLMLLCSLKELSVSCHTMQKRVMELIEQVQNEDVTGLTPVSFIVSCQVIMAECSCVVTHLWVVAGIGKMTKIASLHQKSSTLHKAFSVSCCRATLCLKLLVLKLICWILLLNFVSFLHTQH